MVRSRSILSLILTIVAVFLVSCGGETQPKPEASEQLKYFCRQIIELFNT